ncbi:integration host factor subunit alpha [Acidithiobacillus thiooxidans]|uniref:integration host factor subunit alpha n=1 Tax=Acidithiobacillus thiooxidans TaxID=930 RepID=UPI001C0714CE|nr:integration host factor subunit alpha [Acidithiobacillus thiooxidans]MBU2839452.1 integration host factor subunit alpha [Acidithiobacillus thiooxidans]
MTVTKLELATEVAYATGLTVRDAKHLVEAFFDTIRSTLASGEEVKLSGFGNISIREKTSRPGRNPKTGEPREITARRVVTWRSGQTLRGRC